MHRRQCFLLILALVSVPTLGFAAEDIEVFHSGGNRIRVAKYAPRDLTDEPPASSLLNEPWNTEEEVRWDIAALLALLSKEVYNDDEEMLDFMFRGMGFTRRISIRQDSMVAHVAVCKDATVVVFRGTDITELEDWKKNVLIGPTPFVPADNHRFHHGFQYAYRLVRGDTFRFIDENSANRLWVTGHSLGGAMAVLCTIDIMTSRSCKPVLVTFGQPRVTDSDGAKWIDQHTPRRYARFVHGHDIVPSVPPTVPLLLPYAHAGRLIAMAGDTVETARSGMTAGSVAAARRQRLGNPTEREFPLVYQSAIEPPPLTKQEFDRLLTSEVMAGTSVNIVQLPNGRIERRVMRIIPSYIADHYMDGYVKAVRTFRDRQP